MKGVSCTQGGHNGEQLANMCLAISEDVHNSLMSKNNSNNNATADCINNNKGYWGAFRGPLQEAEGELGLLSLVGAEGGASFLRSFAEDPRASCPGKEPWMEGLGHPGSKPGFTTDAGNSPPKPGFSFL